MSAIKPYLKTLSQPSQLSHCHMYQRFSVGQLAKTKLSHKQNCPKFWEGHASSKGLSCTASTGRMETAASGHARKPPLRICARRGIKAN